MPVEWGGTPPSSWGTCWSRSLRPGPSRPTCRPPSPAIRPGDTGVYVWNLWVFRHEVEQGRLPFYTSSILTGTPTRPGQPQPPQLHDVRQRPRAAARAGGRPRRRLQPHLPLQHRALGLRAVSAGPRADVTRGRIVARRRAVRPSPVLIARGAGHFSLVAAAPLPIFGLLLRKVGATGSVRARDARRRRGGVGHLFGRLLRRLLPADGRRQPRRAVRPRRARRRRPGGADGRPAADARRDHPDHRRLLARASRSAAAARSISSASTSAPTRSTRRCSR